MLNFYKLHLGENARDKFAEQALKNQYWESFYVLPSTVVMQEVRQKNNIRVGNFDTLVKEIIELFSTAIKPPISSFAREVLIKRCAVELFATGKIEYFAKVHQNNFFVKNLASLFAELMSMQISAQDFGFVLGPRINAAGRMDSMEIGIECLIAPDIISAYPLARQLDQLNVERRQVEQHMREQAFDYLEQIHLEQESISEAIVFKIK